MYGKPETNYGQTRRRQEKLIFPLSIHTPDLVLTPAILNSDQDRDRKSKGDWSPFKGFGTEKIPEITHRTDKEPFVQFIQLLRFITFMKEST